MRTRNALRRVLAGAVVVAAAMTAALGGATAASAHDSLVTSSPAADESVAELSEVTLEFSANLLGNEGGNIVIVVGPDGRHYENDCAALAGPALTTPVALGAPGDYQVEWRAVSSDGHPVSGVIPFTYTGEDVSDGAEQSPCASAVGAGEASTDEPAAEAGQMSGLTLGLLVGGGAVVLIGILVVVILSTRSRDDDSSSDAPPGGDTRASEE